MAVVRQAGERKDGTMKTLIMFVAAAFALAMAGPALASIDDYPELWADTALAAAATTTEVAAAPTTGCPAGCGCARIAAEPHRAKTPGHHAKRTAGAAQTKTWTWAGIVPYNY